MLAPSAPCFAPKIGQMRIMLDGVDLPVRPNMGIYTQPISFAGLPVAAVPYAAAAPMPMGVQVIAAQWREDLALRVAQYLERSGVAGATVPGATVAG